MVCDSTIWQKDRIRKADRQNHSVGFLQAHKVSTERKRERQEGQSSLWIPQSNSSLRNNHCSLRSSLTSSNISPSGTRFYCRTVRLHKLLINRLQSVFKSNFCIQWNLVPALLRITWACSGAADWSSLHLFHLCRCSYARSCLSPVTSFTTSSPRSTPSPLLYQLEDH